jgi:hypothetical protein
MTDAQVIESCRDPWTFGGSASNHMHELLQRALPLAPDDPAITANALQFWSHYAMPVADGYSSAGPKRAEGIPLHRQALENAERILLGATLDTDALRALYFWAKQTRMLLRLTAPTISTAEEARAEEETLKRRRRTCDAEHGGCTGACERGDLRATERILVADVCAHPGAPGPMHVYAHWLDERGCSAEADALRPS